MSSRSARALASQRAGAAPTRTAAGTIPATAAGGGDPVKAIDALVAVIPSETLIFYTPIMAALTSQLLKDAPGPDRYMGFRWTIYGVGILLAVVLVAKDRLSGTTTTVPIAEMVCAGLAFGVWALITPDSPLLAETADRLDFTIIVVLTSGGVALVSLLSTIFLTKPVR